VRCWIIPIFIVVFPPIIFFMFRRWRRRPHGPGTAD
jgi:hypothetical protein